MNIPRKRYVIAVKTNEIDHDTLLAFLEYLNQHGASDTITFRGVSDD